jgi:hypothetical protein
LRRGDLVAGEERVGDDARVLANGEAHPTRRDREKQSRDPLGVQRLRPGAGVVRLALLTPRLRTSGAELVVASRADHLDQELDINDGHVRLVQPARELAQPTVEVSDGVATVTVRDDRRRPGVRRL